MAPKVDLHFIRVESDGAESEFQLIFCVRQEAGGRQWRRQNISIFMTVMISADITNLTRWALCHIPSSASESPVLAEVGGCWPVRAQ